MHESMGLKAKKPMLLEIDNEGAVDLANNWSIGGRTRHIKTRECSLRDLKEEGVIDTRWRSGARMSADLFTKNLPGPLFNAHTPACCGEDEY